MPNGVDTVDCPLSTSALSIPTHCLTLSLTLTRSLQHSVATFQHYRRWLQTGSPLVCQLTHTRGPDPPRGCTVFLAPTPPLRHPLPPPPFAAAGRRLGLLLAGHTVSISRYRCAVLLSSDENISLGRCSRMLPSGVRVCWTVIPFVHL